MVSSQNLSSFSISGQYFSCSDCKACCQKRCSRGSVRSSDPSLISIMVPEPLSVGEAAASEHAAEWRAAMDEEISKEKFRCFNKVLRSQALNHGRLVKSKWVFKVKYNSDNTNRAHQSGEQIFRSRQNHTIQQCSQRKTCPIGNGACPKVDARREECDQPRRM